MTDKVWPNMPTGPNEFEQRQDVEQQDVASLQNELNEQQRIADGMHNPFDKNRVPVERLPK
jgi:hypothetical protein